MNRKRLVWIPLLLALVAGPALAVNDYYSHASGVPATGSQGSSSAMRAEFDSVAQGFDKLPTVTGNGDEAVFVNAGGTALTSHTAADARTKLAVPGLADDNTFTGANTIGGSTGGLLPPGTVLPYAGSAAPSGFLLAYGQAVDRTTYADLFTAIGTTYGAGDGVTTFNLPDLRGRAAFGKDDMGGAAASRITNGVSGVDGATLGAAGGSEALHQHTHTASVTDTGHNHGVTDPGHFHSVDENTGGGSGRALAPVNQSTSTSNDLVNSATTGISVNSNTTGISVSNDNSGTGSSQNMPPVIVLNYIIKY